MDGIAFVVQRLVSQSLPYRRSNVCHLFQMHQSVELIIEIVTADDENDSIGELYLCNPIVLFVYRITLCCSLRLSSIVKSSKVGAAFGAGVLG